MDVLKAAILLGATLLIVSIHCNADNKAKSGTQETRGQFESFLKMQKQKEIPRLPAPEPEVAELPPEFNRPNSKVETKGLSQHMSDASDWVKHAMPNKSAFSKAFKSATNVAVKVAKNAAKEAAKGAASAYKNLKEASHAEEQHMAIVPHRQENYQVVPSYNSPQPPHSYPQPQPQLHLPPPSQPQRLPAPAQLQQLPPPQQQLRLPGPQQQLQLPGPQQQQLRLPPPQNNMQIIAAPSFLKPADNFNPAHAIINYQGHQHPYQPYEQHPEEQPEDEKPRPPPTKAEAKEARDALFYRTKQLTRQEVLAYIDTLQRWPEYDQMKKLRRVPIDLELLTRFNQTSEENCNDRKYIKSLEKMHKKLYYQESDHGKALVPFLDEVLGEQLKICNFAQKSIDEFGEFANENPQRWELIKLWNHKVGHYGNRHTNWGSEDQYLNNGIQLNEALDEMIRDQPHRSGQDAYQYGYKLVLALQDFCRHMDSLGGTLSMTRLEKEYKKNKTIREFHRLMSVCEQTKKTNFMQSLSGALGLPRTTYSGYMVY